VGIPTTINMKADTRDTIVTILAGKWPLSAKEVYSEVRETQGLNITYQGVHKVLNQLVDERTALIQDRKYLLSTEWIENLKKFAETAEKNYLKNKTQTYLEVGTGSSVEKDAFIAGKEAAGKALKQIKSNKGLRLVLVFASNIYQKAYGELLRGIQSVTKNSPLAGCTTMGGEINNRNLQKSITVMLLAADKNIFDAEVIAVRVSDGHYQGNGFSDVLEELENKAKLRIDFPDIALVFFPGYLKKFGMRAIAPAFLSELNNRFGASFPLVGCLAGDNWVFEETAQFCNYTASSDAIVFVRIKTKINFGIRKLHAYKPVNNNRYKVKIRNAFIVEMAKVKDDKIQKYQPALDVYLKETKMTKQELEGALPLFVRELIAQNKAPPITRAIDGAHGYPCFLNEKSLRFDNLFDNGDIINVSKTSPTEILKTTQKTIEEASQIGKVTKPVAALLFSCASLEAILNAHNVNEIEIIKKSSALQNVPIFGCYNAGEIGPMAVPQGSGTVVALVFGNELRD